jgi:8-oxo-dGTP pyrophosphatase MutT (NUDIX family)
VCVPLWEDGSELEVWVIKRPNTMRYHSGELAFPGGKPEPHDPDLAFTAIREASEELGIPQAGFRQLGVLAPVPVATSRFAIHPFVNAVEFDAEPSPNADEVTALIRAPIAGFFDRTFAYQQLDFGDYRSPIFTLPAGRLFGASAHVLEELLQICAGLMNHPLPESEMVREVPWQSRS